MPYNFNECKNGNPVKDKAKEIVIADLIELINNRYGEDTLSQVGSNMLAVAVGERTLADGTQGEVCVTIEVVAKDYDVRVAESSGKVFQPYERVREEEEYERTVEKQRAKAEEAKRKREEKAAKDKAAREARKAAKS